MAVDTDKASVLMQGRTKCDRKCLFDVYLKIYGEQ